MQNVNTKPWKRSLDALGAAKNQKNKEDSKNLKKLQIF